VTWNGLTTLAGTIKTYATIAGGSSDSSYYQFMLELIGQYNDEMDKPNPDQKTLDDLAKSIKGVINQEQSKIKSIQDQVKDALDALTLFHDDCKRYESTLGGDQESLKSLLEEEGNDVEHLMSVIEEERKNIEDLQVDIDRGKYLTFSSL
jgi:chromosome segregation ATPase